MFTVLALLLSFTTFAQLSINKAIIEDLNLEYVAPKGTGQVQKIVLGASANKEMAFYPFELTRTEDSLLFQSPVLELTFQNPPKFIDIIEKFGVKKMNASTIKNEHSVKAAYLMFKPKDDQSNVFNGVHFKCLGTSGQTDILKRVFDDCREKMEGSITEMNGPIMRYILDVLSEAPQPLVPDKGANDLEVSLKNGQLFSSVAVKFIITARARVWGEVFYENDYKTIAVRVDQIKYGILPVTRIVLNQLQARIKNPRVKVTPPWIRINLETK